MKNRMRDEKKEGNTFLGTFLMILVAALLVGFGIAAMVMY